MDLINKFRQRRDRLKARKDKAFLADARAATMIDHQPLAGLSLLLLLLAVGAFFLWASQASLDEVTVGNGRVISSSREQVIQSLEGGILAEMKVHEGDTVDAGQVLLRIDDTRFDASYREGSLRAQNLRATIARLRAEANGVEPVFPKHLPGILVEAERKLFKSRQHTLWQSTGALQRSLDLATQELQMTEPLVARGAVSEVEVLRLKRQVNDMRGKIQERVNTFRAEARGELAKREAELGGIKEKNRASRDQVNRAVVRSPVRGTVKNIRLNTVGGVIQSGMDIMEIVPLEDQLLIEARIRPADVAFLRPGLRATVKITAYDFNIYGGLQGELVQISADTLSDERNPKDTYYRAIVRTNDAHLKGTHGPLPIIPGMVATIEVLTGHKTVLDYILKPILKARSNALRER